MPKSTISRPLPPVEYLHECFAYDPETGVLTWKERPREHFSRPGSHLNFLTRWAGRSAGAQSKLGYLHVGVDGTLHPVHRIAWALHYGAWPDRQLDHINLIKDDNRIANLRGVDNATNCRRQVRPRNNPSGCLGVFWNDKSGKWQARIKFMGKAYHLGMFTDKADAIAARKAADAQFGFAENHGQTDPGLASAAGPGRLRKDNKTGHVGAHLVRGRWVARLQVSGRQLHLGSFDTKEEAISARKAAEIQYGVAGRVLYGRGAIIQDPPT